MASRVQHFLKPPTDSLNRIILPKTKISKKRVLWSGFTGEALGSHLFHEEVPPFRRWKPKRWFSDYDLKHPRFNIEMKVSGNGNSWKIRRSQFDRQLGEKSERFDAESLETTRKPTPIAFLIRYHEQEWKNGKRIRLLRCNGNGRSCMSTMNYIVGNIEIVYAIDMRILEMISEQNGGVMTNTMLSVSQERIDRFALRTREEFLKFDYPEESLSRWLPPNAKRILSRRIVTTFQGKEITFPLVPILELGDRRLLFKLLNGQVRPMEQQTQFQFEP